MYCSNNENTTNGNSSSNTAATTISYKETLHISPHIAAHKSSLAASCSSAPTLMNLSSLPVGSSLLTPVVSSDGMTYNAYKLITTHGRPQDMLHSTNIARPAQHTHLVHRKDYSCPVGSVISCNNLRTTVTSLARVVPEDLSATSTEIKLSSHAPACTSSVMTSQYQLNTNSQKPLSHIYTVAGQVPTSLFNGILEKNSTFLRTSDLPNLTGQPQAILVACADPNVEHSSNPTTLAALPPTAIVGEFPQIVGLVNESRIKKENDLRDNGSAIAHQQQQHQLQQHQHITQQQLTLVSQQQQQQQHRDLVRQALQAAVDGSHKASDQELIEYNYSAGDIQDLLMLNITGSGNNQQGTVRAQHTSTATMTGLSVVDAATIGAPMLMMQPADIAAMSGHATGHQQSQQLVAAGVLLVPAQANGGAGIVHQQQLQHDGHNHHITSNNNSSGNISNKMKKIKYMKLSEEQQHQKRQRLAQLMREKRANESEEQKAARRIREAERMRRRRSMESDEQKLRRRLEAAERARLRRASMSPDQRLLDRRKAAERMRLRRLQEGEQQKQQRRKRAAERMRRRRACETPEQRALRRQNLALRMKNRRKRKQEELSITSSSSSLLHEDSLAADMHSLDATMSALEDVKAHDLTHCGATMHESLITGDVVMKSSDAELHITEEQFLMMQDTEETLHHQHNSEEKYSIEEQRQQRCSNNTSKDNKVMLLTHDAQHHHHQQQQQQHAKMQAGSGAFFGADDLSVKALARHFDKQDGEACMEAMRSGLSSTCSNASALTPRYTQLAPLTVPSGLYGGGTAAYLPRMLNSPHASNDTNNNSNNGIGSNSITSSSTGVSLVYSSSGNAGGLRTVGTVSSGIVVATAMPASLGSGVLQHGTQHQHQQQHGRVSAGKGSRGDGAGDADPCSSHSEPGVDTSVHQQACVVSSAVTTHGLASVTAADASVGPTTIVMNRSLAVTRPS